MDTPKQPTSQQQPYRLLATICSSHNQQQVNLLLHGGMCSCLSRQCRHAHGAPCAPSMCATPSQSRSLPAPLSHTEISIQHNRHGTCSLWVKPSHTLTLINAMGDKQQHASLGRFAGTGRAGQHSAVTTLDFHTQNTHNTQTLKQK